MGSKRMKDEQSEGKKNKKKKKHIFLKIFLVLLAVIVIFAGVILGYGYSKLAQIKHDDIDLNQVEVNEGVEEKKGYRNILLLGVDSRENEYTNTLSDSIMVVSINQDTNKVRIASVYRDSYLKVGNKFDKITHAFAHGGAASSLSAINTNLDLNLKEYVAINFDVVIDVVNAVGGVEVELSSEEVKYINKYIKEINNLTDSKTTQINKAGTYNLDGAQALAYSRIRYTAGGDYKRTERHREVLEKAFAKVKKMNLVQLNNVATRILEEVSTNISANEILGLLSQVASYEIEEATGWPFEGGIRGYQPDKVWYGAPVNLENQVKLLHEFLFDEEDYEVSESVKKISDDLIKKTGYK